MKVPHFLTFKRIIASAMAAAMIAVSVGAPRLEAMVVPTQQVAPAAALVELSHDRATVQAALENRLVRQRLHDLGLSDAEIDRRLTRLSGDQLHQVAMQIEKQAPAGDGTGVAITVLVIVLLVLLILKLADDID
jgi:hypothetical protein